jgi:hypothetical protein
MSQILLRKTIAGLLHSGECVLIVDAVVRVQVDQQVSSPQLSTALPHCESTARSGHGCQGGPGLGRGVALWQNLAMIDVQFDDFRHTRPSHVTVLVTGKRKSTSGSVHGCYICPLFTR